MPSINAVTGFMPIKNPVIFESELITVRSIMPITLFKKSLKITLSGLKNILHTTNITKSPKINPINLEKSSKSIIYPP